MLGKTGEQHIYSSDDGALYASIVGGGQYVLSLGERLAANVVSANTIRIYSGECLVNGRLGRIRPGSYEEISVMNGSSGYNRADMIIVRYTKESEIESMELDILTGTTTTSETPDLPSYAVGNIYDGDLLVEFPLYRVDIKGVGVPAVTPLFTMVDLPLADLSADYTSYKTTTNGKLDQLEIDPEVQALFDAVIPPES